uniref:2-hydroxyacyl-CoA lyase 2 n=2 Tax=Meloidogyne TaxID=189290 RepID=A0A914LBY1_MELIC
MFLNFSRQTLNKCAKKTNLILINSKYFSTKFNIDKESKKHGGELVASVLKVIFLFIFPLIFFSFLAHNVKEIFTLCGGHISPILVSSEQLGIKIYDTRHEVNAVFAADAVARLRQHIGVAAVTSGPGVTNTITSLKNAQLAESPVILLAGAAPSLMKGKGALQDIDQIPIIQSMCKFTARIINVEDIVPTLREAISVSQSGTPGPVFIEFPLDVLQSYQEVLRDASFIKNPDTPEKQNFNESVYQHIYRQFHNAWSHKEFGPLPVTIPKPNIEDITKIADILENAKRPLLLMGSQSTLPPLKTEQLVQIVNNLGIPTYLGGMSRGLLGANSPLQMRQNRKIAIKEADVILLAGAVCDFRLTYGKGFSPGTKVISINRSQEQMLKNHGVFWNSAATIQADVGLTLLELQNQMKERKWGGLEKCKEWIEMLREMEIKKEEDTAKKLAQKPDDGHMNPLVLLTAMDEVIPKDAILVADGGDFVGSAAYIVRPGGPLQWLDPGTFGTLGVGAGFALGAKAVYPERTVVIIYGDGSAGYSLMEFDTFVRHKLPVVGIIGNDACWTQIAREQVPHFKSAVACDLDYTHYEEAAKALGAQSLFLDGDMDVKQVREALAQVMTRSRAEKQSLVVNVLIGKTNFREGSISV